MEGTRGRRTRRRLSVAGVLLLCGFVAVAVQTPPQPRVADFAANEVSVIAHSGAQGHAPTNTLTAFDVALEQGADILEMDLQLTAEGEVVVIHDGTVDRTTDGTGAVADMTVEQLQALDAGWYFEDEDGDHPFRDLGIRIPTFRQVLDRYNDTHLIVELKTESPVAIAEPVIDLLRDYGRDDGSVTVASFSTDYLEPVRAALPDVPTNMPEGETTGFYIRQLVGLHPWWSPPGEVFQVPEYHDGRHVVTDRFVNAANRLGVDVQVWTVNEPEQMDRLLDAGVHGIMTDYPDRLVAVLAEREAAARTDPGGYGDQIERAERLQGGPAWLLALLHAVTFLGDEEFYLLAFPLLYWAVSRRLGIRLGVMLLLSDGINKVGKLVTATPRPPFFDPALERVPESTFGVPSAHAQNGVAVWGLLAAGLRRWAARVAVLAVVAAIGWSRVHLGAHFLEDVVVGWGIGALLLVLYLVLEPRVRRWAGARGPVEWVMAGLVTSWILILGGVLMAGRLRGFDPGWPGLLEPAEAASAADVVTPAATLAGMVIGLALLVPRGGFDHRGPLRRRAVRVLVGLAGVVGLWMGLGAVFPDGGDALALVLRYVRYVLVGAWVGGIAPLLFVRLGLADAAPAPSELAEVPGRGGERVEA
ncbi:MAG TPA: glycerophosphodiester phosphodiesterase family protein [Egicoccus sp.]|nr:glycerophosphodiester phosphodiesterase family protein [Egicoccus sp.]HSK23254.1 glycerophosphodiester phosphodiesterase family protein [Egicoccus sp.]